MVKKNHEKSIESAASEYKEFSSGFVEGICYLCGEKIVRFDQNKPCLHWLLRKHKRVKKKHIKQLLDSKEIFQVISYLRWVAKTEGKLSQVNDFEAYEANPKLIYQENIKYEDTEWTFWVKKEDLEGHKDQYSSFPHYHLQITIDGRPFVNFSDFHIALSEWEIFNIYARKGAFPSYKYAFPFGESYLDLFTFLPEEKIVDEMVATDDEKKAQYHLQTFIEADPGTTIKGEDIAKLIEERKKTGVPLAKLVQKLKNVRAKTIVMPENLIEPVSRKKRKR
ncbi:hypothetical protein HYT59_02000 [Candidatus Woesebacteria bacterium]|nr:hypothetical protein [Candidatus Woesebacteria bacterium]